jgi:hypothetical protein
MAFLLPRKRRSLVFMKEIMTGFPRAASDDFIAACRGARPSPPKNRHPAAGRHALPLAGCQADRRLLRFYRLGARGPDASLRFPFQLFDRGKVARRIGWPKVSEMGGDDFSDHAVIEAYRGPDVIDLDHLAGAPLLCHGMAYHAATFDDHLYFLSVMLFCPPRTRGNSRPEQRVGID